MSEQLSRVFIPDGRIVAWLGSRCKIFAWLEFAKILVNRQTGHPWSADKFPVTRLTRHLPTRGHAVAWSRPQWFDSLNVPKSDQISWLLIAFFVMGLLRRRNKVVDDILILIRNSMYFCKQDFAV